MAVGQSHIVPTPSHSPELPPLQAFNDLRPDGACSLQCLYLIAPLSPELPPIPVSGVIVISGGAGCRGWGQPQ